MPINKLSTLGVQIDTFLIMSVEDTRKGIVMIRHQGLWVAIMMATALISWPNTMEAQDLPHYDRDTYCERVTQGNRGDPSIRKLCFEAEQAGYQAVRAAWHSLPADIRATCEDIGVRAGGSYYALSNCVTPHLFSTMAK